MTDIALNFMTTYLDINGDEVLDPKKIATNYLKGAFWIDFISAVPIDNFLVMFSDVNNTSTEVLTLTDLLKVVRILRLGRIIRFARVRDDVKGLLNLVQLTLYIIM